MNLWDKIAPLFSAPDRKYKTPFFEPNQSDVEYDPSPIEKGKAYLRLWLVEMRLAKGVQWFQNRYAVVYTATRYWYAGQTVTIPYIAGVDQFKEWSDHNLDKVVSQNFVVTPLFPYTRGTIEIQAGLFSMQASNPINAFIGTMNRFASLLPVPELSTVLNIAAPLCTSMENLFDVGQSRMELGYQEAFAPAGGGGANDLRAGYFAVILATDQDFKDNLLRIKQDGIYIVDGNPGESLKELESFSYMLFRWERRSEQDWEALPSISNLVNRVQDAILDDKQDIADELFKTIRIAIARSPDIVKDDRIDMYRKIEEELRELGLQGQRGRGAKRSLFQIMQRQLPQLNAEAKNEWDSLEKIVRDGK